MVKKHRKSRNYVVAVCGIGSRRIHALSSKSMTRDEAKKEVERSTLFWRRGGFKPKIMPCKKATKEFRLTHFKKGKRWIEKDAPSWSPDYGVRKLRRRRKKRRVKKIRRRVKRRKSRKRRRR